MGVKIPGNEDVALPPTLLNTIRESWLESYGPLTRPAVHMFFVTNPRACLCC